MEKKLFHPNIKHPTEITQELQKEIEKLMADREKNR